MSVPVICDRCRATGVAGAADFSHLGDLLDFTPVPRKTLRADGWTPDKQRAFIAALSATGSKRRAAGAIGMAAYGVDQLLKSDGSDSFKAAFARAMAIAAQHGSMKIAQGVADAAARNAQLTPPSRLRGLPPPAGPDDDAAELEMSDEQRLELVQRIAAKFLAKVAAERAARLGGEVVAADFYLRQVTFMEVLFDLAAARLGFNARELLHDLRRGSHGVMEIVSTAFSDWLDTARRHWWAQEGAPERPPHPSSEFLHRHDYGPWGARGEEAYATARDQHATGATTFPARGYTREQWEMMDADAQAAARQAQFDEDAASQRAWEARAHREYEERRASDASS